MLQFSHLPSTLSKAIKLELDNGCIGTVGSNFNSSPNHTDLETFKTGHSKWQVRLAIFTESCQLPFDRFASMENYTS